MACPDSKHTKQPIINTEAIHQGSLFFIVGCEILDKFLVFVDKNF